MPDISKISIPDDGEYNLKDAKAQTKVMSAPITIKGESFTEVEETLQELADISTAIKVEVENENLKLNTSEMFSGADADGDFLIDSGDL